MRLQLLKEKVEYWLTHVPEKEITTEYICFTEDDSDCDE